MSVKIMGKVWDLELPHNKLIVLLALADHADHEGNNVFPSIGLIAWKTGYSEAQVRRIERSLVKDGILVEVSRRPGKTTRYRINTDAGTQKAAYTPVKMLPLAASDPLHSYATPDPLHGDTPTPSTAVLPESSENRHIEPSILSPSGEKQKKSKSETTPAALMNPMKDAIVAAFGWDWNLMTRIEKGLVQVTAKELCEVKFEPERVASLHAWCKAKFTSITPRALSAHVSEYRASRLEANGKPKVSQARLDLEAALRIETPIRRPLDNPPYGGLTDDSD